MTSHEPITRTQDAAVRQSLLKSAGMALALLALCAAYLSAETRVTRPVGTSGTVIIPDHFLRRWDPVTIFFMRDIGPAKGGPEDHPERALSLTPYHPGAFTWLDARTLQFRPAEPWPALTHFSVQADEARLTLATLLSAPTGLIPEDGAIGLAPLESITLDFPEPLDTASLARMTTIELRPLPGVGGLPARVLTSSDFGIKTVDKSRYVINLREPIPLGTRACLRLRLSLDDKEGVSFVEYAFQTAEPFRVTHVGCQDKRYPVTPAGTRYSREQAIDCGAERRSVSVEFSAPPAAIDAVIGRNLVRFTPAVDKLDFRVEGNVLEVAGDFARDTLYEVRLAPAQLFDRGRRKLDQRGESAMYVHFPRQGAYVKWGASQGIVERYGPQMAPVTGRGQERVDLRIYKIDPFDRSFWPFPDQPISIDESLRPPGPGEEPAAVDPLDPPPAAGIIARYIRALGSPPVSALVDLPLRRERASASFGLDLSAQLARISGKSAPGTYLVGLRDLGAGNARSWMRLQVSDLSLSTIEEARAVRFVVTSLVSGQPVVGARVQVEGIYSEAGRPAVWQTFASGVTDASGGFGYQAPGEDPAHRRSWQVRRIAVANGEDTLILDPSRAPERYADNQWSRERTTWLQWAWEYLGSRGAQKETLCHIFTERPVYRPAEEVHIKGYLRQRERGHLAPWSVSGRVIVTGPGDLEYRYPANVTPAGSFYQKFQEKDLPTGVYRARFEDAQGVSHGSVSFRVEAYRIPRFEVTLHAPERATLDAEFAVTMTAAYYAGGRVGGQPVQWRVTQFPYAWSPKARAGFVYSTDSRFSQGARFESTPRLEKEDQTSETGEAGIRLNPALEPNALPRTYVVEATVTGADDQTVTATRSIPALPPFVLGVKAPRYLDHARQIAPEVIAVDASGELIVGKEITVRLLRREWHSHLRASDFSDGVARYITDVVDQKISERKIASAAQPVVVTMPIDKAGVYVIELSAVDALSRAQVVSVDLYAGGEGPVAWQKPATQVFSVATDKPRYNPGEAANAILKSPFQTAHALAIVEAPEGNRYDWIPVIGGAATYHLPILGTYAPRVPVHFVLMRGRLPGTQPLPGNSTDLGRPATLAATAWFEVSPTAHQATVVLDHPEIAQPGQKINVAITLKDPQGLPLAGEVTLWLVDQAVLALGKEQRLDPLPDFITAVRSHLSAHDTRNLAFGALPFAESPGGDESEGGKGGLLDRTTVRKNFKSVPYYNPSIVVGADGKATVAITLSDDLTNFKVRAKAACGAERFGVGTGTIAVRLPVIVQPALPRFVRPQDSFTATAIGRVVEGQGGPGAAELRATGLKITGATRKTLAWVANKPERIEFPAEVETPPYTAEGKLARDQVVVRLAVERTADGARDAFEAVLPIRDDRERVTRRVLKDLAPGAALDLPAITEPFRAGTFTRRILVSREPALVRMAAGLDFLMAYPYGCTEQQISRARVFVALKKFRDLLKQGGSDQEIARVVRATLEWLPKTVDANGLVAYWPGSNGHVALTAWVVEFLVEAKAAGFTVDDALLTRLMHSLEQALRSDYSRFIDGESYAERSMALVALARAGRFDPGYAAELARKAQFLDLEGVAEVVQAFAVGKQGGAAVDQLVRTLAEGVIVRLHQGREIYGGLQEHRSARSGLILPTETRTIAEILRGLARVAPKHERLPILKNAIVTLGRDDGWGTTNANAAALLALSELFVPSAAAGESTSVSVQINNQEKPLILNPQTPIGSLVCADPGAVRIALPAGSAGVVIARVETSFVPAGDGSQVASRAEGFVVTRELLRLRAANEPPERVALAAAGKTVSVTIGETIEDRVQVVNPKERHYVAVVVPLAAGLEPLNPHLATAPPEAQPSGRITRAPTYAAYLDDQVAFYYNTLPAGTYDFAFRTRATIAGSFIQPPAKAEMMYDGSVVGSGVGARIVVAPAAPKP
ncbi:MAG: MG2 domain-containing protein [Vicinamibacteria bacterium]|nr:MG2 domain-containing protein [Vicinamibacteria bacterium]